MTKQSAPLDMKIGTKFKTRKHGYAKVIEYYNCHTVIIEFENSNNIRAITATKLRAGNVSDRSVAPESILVGEKVYSDKHGWLTIEKVESENIILLTNVNKENIQMLLPAVQRMRNKSVKKLNSELKQNKAVSLKDLTKKNKVVNSLVKKMLSDYGK